MDDSLTTYVLAPLAGYTDLPYRMACRECGCQYAYTALIDAGALVHGNPENEHILRRGDSEPWLGVQLLGSIPADVAQAAEMLNQMRYDAFDFNMGCPMQKILRRNAGAALLRPENHELAFALVSLIRERVTGKPFTVKLRILDFDDPAPTVEFCRRLVELGVEGITIHGRLAKNIYAGPVAWKIIRAVREAVDVPVTANGGVYNLRDARLLAEYTGCRRIMIARGSLGNPWIFRELATGAPADPNHEELCDVMKRHVLGMIEEYGEKPACLMARKIIIAYIKGRGYRKTFRVQAEGISSLEMFLDFMGQFASEGPVSAVCQLDKQRDNGILPTAFDLQ